VQSITFGEEYTINSNTVNSAHISASKPFVTTADTTMPLSTSRRSVSLSIRLLPNGLQLSQLLRQARTTTSPWAAVQTRLP
jgi:hypothetical protein